SSPRAQDSRREDRHPMPPPAGLPPDEAQQAFQRWQAMAAALHPSMSFSNYYGFLQNMPPAYYSQSHSTRYRGYEERSHRPGGKGRGYHHQDQQITAPRYRHDRERRAFRDEGPANTHERTSKPATEADEAKKEANPEAASAAAEAVQHEAGSKEVPPEAPASRADTFAEPAEARPSEAPAEAG
ncbi:unnamed protein product, partial [Durusdinium trenchii]